MVFEFISVCEYCQIKSKSYACGKLLFDVLEKTGYLIGKITYDDGTVEVGYFKAAGFEMEELSNKALRRLLWKALFKIEVHKKLFALFKEEFRLYLELKKSNK